MLTIYRRHRKSCSHRNEGRKYRRCYCPIWMDGFLGDEEIRESLQTRDWQKAQEIVRQWEAEGLRSSEPAHSQPVTIHEASQKFLADAEARKLNEATIYKYRLLFRQIENFAERRGLRFVEQLDVDTLGMFRAEWHDSPRSSLKKLERLRAFFHFAEKRKWVEGNPASELKAPRVPARPTMPFTHEEMTRVIAALDFYADRTARNGRANAHRLRSLVFLLRYSGMRIGDAISLSTDRITGNRLFLYTAKTGVPVYTVVPDFVVRILESTPRMTERYYFWSGAGKFYTAVRVWETRLRKLFGLAKMPGGHAHRFRDTFAVELLLAGVPLERVSMLLGHQSVRVTERHYAPWVRSRQEQLEADVARAWNRDPIVLVQTKGTPQVHGNSDVVN